MPDVQLSPQAQQWLNVVLIWIGFGALGGLAARAVLPVRWPQSAAGTLVLGIVGSTLGLGVLSAAFGTEGFNPIGPLGLLAAVAGAAALLLVAAVVRAGWMLGRRESDDSPPLRRRA
jgi:uncharacterized membrane protein YeaQ/YmgE (transglycosylase-associated protein family)